MGQLTTTTRLGQINCFSMPATWKAILTVVAFIAEIGAQDLQQHVLGERDYVSHFNEWTKTHKKSYRGNERDYRFKQFRQAHDLINKHNADPTHKFKLGHNQFSDMSHDEFKATMLGLARGPVSVAIEADQSAFQFYKSGVFPATSCGSQLDHGVLVVGYGSLDNDKYWIVKNSWGATWGLDGFILLEKDLTGSSDGTCGVASQPSQPSII